MNDESAEILDIVARWYVSVNNGCGLDADDLIRSLGAGGFGLPEIDE